MSYRRTRKYDAERLRRAQATRERNRVDGPAPDYPSELPELRMRITVERMDFGREVHVFELQRTLRVDVYAVSVDGTPCRGAGLSATIKTVIDGLDALNDSAERLGITAEDLSALNFAGTLNGFAADEMA